MPILFTYFDTVPTVAHRANQVGINTRDLNVSDILVVENYYDKRLIILKGTQDAHMKTIVIDLVQGSITGATIDGGSW